MSRAYPANPWRKGLAAGETYMEARQQWAAQPRDQRGEAPVAPFNPYPVPDYRKRTSKNNGHTKWLEGFKESAKRHEQKRRCGGKPPSWR